MSNYLTGEMAETLEFKTDEEKEMLEKEMKEVEVDVNVLSEEVQNGKATVKAEITMSAMDYERTNTRIFYLVEKDEEWKMRNTENLEMLVSEAKDDASECYSSLVENGAPTGEEADITSGGTSESICGDICTGEWQGKEGLGVISGATANGTTVDNQKQACLAGKPEWIVKDHY